MNLLIWQTNAGGVGGKAERPLCMSVVVHVVVQLHFHLVAVLKYLQYFSTAKGILCGNLTEL